MASVWTYALRDRLGLRISISSATLYVLIYLYSIGHIVVAPGMDLAYGRETPAAFVIADWSSKLWKPIAPFVWEPIAAIYLHPSVALFLAVPNLLLALFLGVLVGLNMSVALARARLVMGGASGGSLRGLLASLPALLTGFTCCVPSIIIALGSLATGFAVAAIAIGPYLLPVGAVLLILNLLWSSRQYSNACALRPINPSV